MSPEEIAWRVRSSLRDRIDGFRVAFRVYPKPFPPSVTERVARTRGFRVSETGPGDCAAGNGLERKRLANLIEEADRIREGRLTFLGLEDAHLGIPVDWNRDHLSGKKSPMVSSQKIDYRDHRMVGDAKLVWEPNRHHQMVVLGRAYRATGNRDYAFAVRTQIESWKRDCPFGKGMNWRSPLELAIRLINWVWAYDMVREANVFDGPSFSRLLHDIRLHVWEVSRKYSKGSSANNHTIGEAAGVFIAASYFADMPGAGRLKGEAREILCREIIAQTFPDGGGKEQATGYHLFILQFFLFAGLAAGRSGDEFPGYYWDRLEKMLEFVGRLSEGGGGGIPQIGDCDDGYVLDLGSRHKDALHLLSVGAVLFKRADFKTWCGGFTETAFWLFGSEGKKTFDGIDTGNIGKSLTTHAFHESGYSLLQSGDGDGDDRISVLFDHGELGYRSIAAHGHADALSFTLRVNGADFVVDPGTYDYFTFPAWRDYFRSTRAHNTVVVDGTDQSEMLGPFMWGKRARSRCILWEPKPQGGLVEGEHDGYRRLRDPVTHRRQIELDGETNRLTIRDLMAAKGEHQADFLLHFSEDCTIRSIESHRFEIARPGKRIELKVDPKTIVQIYRGREGRQEGWISRSYHQKRPGTTMLCTSRFRGDATYLMDFAFSPSPPDM